MLELDGLKEKVRVYEQFLHLLQMHAEVTLNGEMMRRLISNACRWSYAHRCGNGELSDEDQQKLVDAAFERLCSTS
jgi:hypothetical protein